MNTPNGSVKREALVVAAVMQVYGDTPLMLGNVGGRGGSISKRQSKRHSVHNVHSGSNLTLDAATYARCVHILKSANTSR